MNQTTTQAAWEIAEMIGGLCNRDAEHVRLALQSLALTPRAPVKVKRLHPAAVLPVHATAGAACFDLIAVDADNCERHPNDVHGVIFGTGLAFEIPPGFVMLIFSRSGQGFNNAVRLSNCVGVIDSDYRGEVKVALRFDASADYRCPKVRSGDRIAQAMIVAAPAVALVEADELGETERGAGGFGSTGTSVGAAMGSQPMSDRDWAALPADQREGTTTHAPGVGHL